VNLVAAGRTFFSRSGPPHPTSHLWIVLTDPDPTTTHVVIVMIVTARDHTDKTVTLPAGCHPFINRDSNVAYSTADIILAKKLESALKNGRCTLDADLNGKPFDEARAGLRVSSRTPNYVVEHCEGRF